MRFIKRFAYLLYYFKEFNFKQTLTFLSYSSSKNRRSGFWNFFDALISVFKYNISIKDYFYFRFFELKMAERRKWAGSGFMYEYQLKMNPKEVRSVLEDKIQFLNHFHSFVKRAFFSLNEIKENIQLAETLLTNPSGRAVLKYSHGQVGAEVEIVSCNDFTASSLIEYMTERHFDLAEEYVLQHSSIMALSPSGLNTIRVFTQLHNGVVNFLGARFRISVNSPVDNMGAGNLAATVDIDTGEVKGSGVYSDITKEDKAIHPVTGEKITGFQLPYWKEVLDLSKRAALHTPENKSIGWDIAITEEGPELIEGNHNWCKLLWQLPIKKGMKTELEKYI